MRNRLREMYLAVAEAYYGPERYAKQLGLFDAPRTPQPTSPFDADRAHRAKLRSDIDAGVDLPDHAFGRHNDLRELAETRRRQKFFTGGDKYDIGAAQSMPDAQTGDTESLPQQYATDQATLPMSSVRQQPREPKGTSQGGQFASTGKQGVTPPPLQKSRQAKRGWKLSEGYTRDRSVVDKIVRSARSKGYDVEVETIKNAYGEVVNYAIAVFSKKGKRMSRPKEFYDVQAAIREQYMLRDLARAYFGPERYAQQRSLFDGPTGGAPGDQPALDWVRKTGERGSTYWYNRITNPNDDPKGRLYQKEQPTVSQARSVGAPVRKAKPLLGNYKDAPSGHAPAAETKSQLQQEQNLVAELVKQGKPVPPALAKKHAEVVKAVTEQVQQQVRADLQKEREQMRDDLEHGRQVHSSLLKKHPDIAKIVESERQRRVAQSAEAKAQTAVPRKQHQDPSHLKAEKGEKVPRSGHIGITEYPGHSFKYNIENPNPGGIPEHHDALETRLVEENNELYRVSIVGTSSGQLYSHIEVGDTVDSSPGKQTVHFRPATKDETTVIASKTDKQSPVAALERKMWKQAKHNWRSGASKSPESDKVDWLTQRNLFSLADSFAVAVCEKYAPRWNEASPGFRKKAKLSPGQVSFDFAAEDTANILRQWDFEDEVLHPRGPNGRWVSKNQPEQIDKPAPLFAHERIDDIATALSKGDKETAIKSIGADRIDQATAKRIMGKMGIGESEQNKQIASVFHDPDIKRVNPTVLTRRFVSALTADMYSYVARAYYGPERYAAKIERLRPLKSAPGQMSMFDNPANPATAPPQSSGDWVRKKGAHGSTYWYNRRTNPNDEPEGRKYQEHAPSQQGEVSAPVGMKHREVNPMQTKTKHRPVDLDAIKREYKSPSSKRLDRRFNDFAAAMSRGDRERAEKIYTDSLHAAIRKTTSAVAKQLGLKNEDDIDAVSQDIGVSLFSHDAAQHDLSKSSFLSWVWHRAKARLLNIPRDAARRPEGTSLSQLGSNDDEAEQITASVAQPPENVVIDSALLKDGIEAFLQDSDNWQSSRLQQLAVKWAFGIDSPTGEPIMERKELSDRLAEEVPMKPVVIREALNRLFGPARGSYGTKQRGRVSKVASIPRGGILKQKLTAFLQKHQNEYEQLASALVNNGFVSPSELETAASKYAAAYLLVKYMQQFDQFHANPERYLLHELRIAPERYVYGQFDPAKHERHGKGDPEGKGGQFAPKHGASPAGTQGIEMPKPGQPDTKAFAPAAPPVPKPSIGSQSSKTPNLKPAAKPQQAQAGGGVQTAIALALLAAGALAGKKGLGGGLLAAAAVPHLTGAMRTQAKQAKAILEQDPKNKFGKELAESARKIDAQLKAMKTEKKKKAESEQRAAERARNAAVRAMRTEVSEAKAAKEKELLPEKLKSMEARASEATHRAVAAETKAKLASELAPQHAATKKMRAEADVIRAEARKLEAKSLAEKRKWEAEKREAKVKADKARHDEDLSYIDSNLNSILTNPKAKKNAKSRVGSKFEDVLGEALTAHHAKEWGVPIEDYNEMAKQAFAGGEVEASREREQAKKAARKFTGLNAGMIHMYENKGYDHGYAGVQDNHKLDEAYTELARQFPSLGWDADSTDTEVEQKVWDLIKEGTKETFGPHQPEYHEKLSQWIQHNRPDVVMASSEQNDPSLSEDDKWRQEDIGDAWEPEQPVKQDEDDSVPFSMHHHAHRELYTHLHRAYYGGKV